MGIFDTDKRRMRRADRKWKMSKIYAIADGSGYIKIGFSLNVRTRLQELQTSNPHKLKLLGSVEGSKKLEKLLHKHLAGCRHRGEWFRDCDESRQVAKLIAAKNKFELSELLSQPTKGRR